MAKLVKYQPAPWPALLLLTTGPWCWPLPLLCGDVPPETWTGPTSGWAHWVPHTASNLSFSVGPAAFPLRVGNRSSHSEATSHVCSGLLNPSIFNVVVLGISMLGGSSPDLHAQTQTAHFEVGA